MSESFKTGFTFNSKYFTDFPTYISGSVFSACFSCLQIANTSTSSLKNNIAMDNNLYPMRFHFWNLAK